MYMNEGLDTGDIISSVTIPIGDETTGGQLYETLAQTGAGLLVKTLEDIENGRADVRRKTTRKRVIIRR
jgi:methionyl-tRNA formyltransferase